MRNGLRIAGAALRPVAASPLEATVSIAGWNTETGETLTDEFTIPISESDGSYHIFNVQSESAYWDASYINAWGNVDPSTNLAFGITNVAAVPVEFTFSILLPIAPIAGATVHGGSTGGSVSDSNGNGIGGLTTITSVAGVPFYAGQIDGVTVLPIYPDPTSFPPGGVFPMGTFSTYSIPAANVGLPATLPSGPAPASIGIVQRFKLAPGDSMASSSVFNVEPAGVPEPSTMILALGGVLALGWHVVRRRRRV